MHSKDTGVPDSSQGSAGRHPEQSLARWRSLALGLLVLSVLVFRYAETPADPDLWGHIRFGQDFWQTGVVERPDTYSYLSGNQPWFNHEWLAEVLFALVYDASGAPGLIALKILVMLLIAGLLYGHLRRGGLASLRAWALVLVGCLLLLVGLGTVRPQMFTLLGFSLLLLILYQAEQGRTGWLWVLPLLFALWVNLHGGFLAGLAILWLWALAHLLTDLLKTRSLASLISRRSLALVLVVVLSTLATLLNPYDIRLPLFLLRTATIPRPAISEWQPLNIVSIEGGLFVLLVVAALAGFVASRRERSLALVLLFVISALLALSSFRHLPLFALATLVFAGEHMGDAWHQFASRRGTGKVAGRRDTLEAGLLGLFLLTAIGFLVASIPQLGCISVDPLQYPHRAVLLLKQSGANGNMAVDFDWGEYAIWHLGPGIQVSVDGRRETVYDLGVYLQNLAFMFGAGEWDALLTGYDTEMALVRAGSPAHNLLEARPGWLVLYEDDVSAIAVEEASPLTEQFGTLPPPSGLEGISLCFP